MFSVTLRGKSCLAALLGVAAAGILCWAGTAPVVAAFAPERPLPIYSVETEKKQISLGINCAWDNEDIPELLQTLEEKQVKATFFILGQWSDKYPDSVKAIAQAGHEIGSHSDSHRDLDSLTREEITAEVTGGISKLEKITGQPVRLIRPPSGAYNDLAIRTIHELGYLPIQWDADSLDWKGLTAQEIVQRILDRADKGSITLLHSGAEHTSEALPLLIDALKQEGYEIVPVGEMVYWDNYEIDVQGRQHSLVKN